MDFAILSIWLSSWTYLVLPAMSAKGTAILTLASIIISLFFHLFSLQLLLGFVLGGIYTVFNFYRLGKSIENMLEMPPAKAQTYMTGQYFLRLLTTGLVIFISFKADFINYFGIIIPLIFPKLTLFFCEIFRKEEKS